MGVFKPIFFFTLALILSSCNLDPEPIQYGEDECHWCQMKIMDPKFGTEAVTAKGRKYKFDSSECLLHYLHQSEVEHSALVVTDFDRPRQFMDAKTAYFLVSEKMPSPMGGYLNAFSSEDRASEVRTLNEGKVYSWDQILSEYAK